MRRDRQGTTHQVRPWWRPLAFSAATVAAIAALFNPLPAQAAPNVPVPAAPVAVPDSGSRPAPLGSIAMPGAVPSTTTPATTTPVTSTNPKLAAIERQRSEIAALGDNLIRIGEERDIARTQVITANQKVADAQAALAAAELEAAQAAADAMRNAAAMPAGALGSGLKDLDELARIQRGESAGEQAAARRLTMAKQTQAAALADQQSTVTRATDSSARYDTLNAQIVTKQAALAKDEQRNSGEISAAEAQQSAADRALGEGYLDGSAEGRGADPRALAAVQFALAQRGLPYQWSEEGPNSYDCSGLMYAAYRRTAAGNYPLTRVSRDQYNQTRKNSVDRYSLVPGDLLFFSSSSSWRDIHHVAMYAGDGMMVEAPRTGLDVRLVPVRWSRLFAATRIWGSVEGVTKPDLNAPANPGNGGTTTKPSTPKPTKTTTKPGTTPPTKPSKPPTTDPGSTPPSSGPPSSGPPSSGPPSSGPPPTSGSPSPSQSDDEEEEPSTAPTSSSAQPDESDTAEPSATPSPTRTKTESPSAPASESASASESAAASESASAGE